MNTPLSINHLSFTIQNYSLSYTQSKVYFLSHHPHNIMFQQFPKLKYIHIYTQKMSQVRVVFMIERAKGVGIHPR